MKSRKFVKRGKQTERFKSHIKTKEFYDFFGSLYFKTLKPGNTRYVIDRTSPYYMSRAEYNNIIEDFNVIIRNKIVLENFEFKMPYRLGTLSIKKSKSEPRFDEDGKFINTLPVNWKETLDLWEVNDEARYNKKLVRHKNEHTNGYICRWVHTKTTSNVKNKNLYKFIACRDAKNLLSNTLVTDNTKDYYVLR